MADILIKGMEMPKNCGTCPLRHGDCIHRIYMENRPDSCPMADQSEVMIYGYPARHLAFVASVMAKENIPPEEVASFLRDSERMFRMIVSEQKGIVEETMRRMVGEIDGQEETCDYHKG